MKVIHKYPLAARPGEAAAITKILTPKGSFKPLVVQFQKGIPCLWAEIDYGHHDPVFLSTERLVRIIGTGRIVPADGYSYCGTFQLEEGDLVLHVYADCREAK